MTATSLYFHWQIKDRFQESRGSFLWVSKICFIVSGGLRERKDMDSNWLLKIILKRKQSTRSVTSLKWHIVQNWEGGYSPSLWDILCYSLVWWEARFGGEKSPHNSKLELRLRCSGRWVNNFNTENTQMWEIVSSRSSYMIVSKVLAWDRRGREGPVSVSSVQGLTICSVCACYFLEGTSTIKQRVAIIFSFLTIR